MLKKTITYTDFNGDKRTEDFYFNMTKSELTQMELSVDGGMSGLLKQIIDTEDNKELVAIFKKIILASVGVKSADGKYFRKSEEISNDFVSSPAFDELFLGLFTDGDLAAEFVKGIMPADVAVKVDSQMKADVMDPLGVIAAVSDSSADSSSTE